MRFLSMPSPTAVRRKQELEIAAGLYTREQLKMRRRLMRENFGRARLGKELLTEADLLIRDAREAIEEKNHKRLVKEVEKLRR